MAHPGAYGPVVTIRDDGPTKTVLVHDQDGNELGELAIDVTPSGWRVVAYGPEAAPAGTLVVRS